jgi:hypothetical protein
MACIRGRTIAARISRTSDIDQVALGGEGGRACDGWKCADYTADRRCSESGLGRSCERAGAEVCTATAPVLLAEEVARLGDLHLVPGMPTQVFYPDKGTYPPRNPTRVVQWSAVQRSNKQPLATFEESARITRGPERGHMWISHGPLRPTANAPRIFVNWILGVRVLL